MLFRCVLSPLLCSFLALLPALGMALPQGGTVENGEVTFSQPDASTLNVHQNSQHSLINWNGFSIGETETAQFFQPNADAVSINRVSGGNVSEILGKLSANGKVFLINPNGIVFGQHAQVDVGGLVATTADLQTADFTNGTFQFTATERAASIVNDGSLTAAEGGLVALVAPIVRNNGVITAKLGQVVLHWAETFSVDLYGDQLVSLAVPHGTLADALAENSGEIYAAGGLVTMSAGQAADALNNVVNMDGLIRADTLDTKHGRIVLGSGHEQTTVDGTLAAQGQKAGETGGEIDVLGQMVLLASLADLNADGQAGGGDIHIGGAFQGGAALPTAENTAVFSDVVISANALDNGNGGEVVVWADNTTYFAGDIAARGGENGGDGGAVEVSGKTNLMFRGDVDTAAPQGALGRLLLDPQDIVITDSAGVEAQDPQVADGVIYEAEDSGLTYTLSALALEGLAGSTNITLEAERHITLNDLADNELTLATNGQVAFKANSNLDGTGDFTMNAGDTIVTGGAPLTIVGANVTVGELDTFNGSGGNITLTGNTVSLNGDLTTNSGNLIINGAIALNNHVTFDAGNGSGNVLFSSDMIGDYNFSIDAGINGNVQLNTVDVNALSFISANNVSLYGDIETDIQQDYSNVLGIAVVRDLSLISRDGALMGNITFANTNTLDGNNQLTLIGNDITLSNIGTITPLDTLTVTADGVIRANSNITTRRAITFNGATELTGNLATDDSDIDITGPVTLLSSMGMNTGSGAGDITLRDTVDGTFNLILNSGTGSIDVIGEMGGNSLLNALDMTGNSLAVRAGARTVGAQDYSGASSIAGAFRTSNQDVTFSTGVALMGDTLVDTASGAGDVTFNGEINGAYDLMVNNGTGDTYFNATVGNITPLGDIIVTGNTLALNNMTSTGQQQYTGTLTLNGDINVGSGAIDLVGDVVMLGHSGLNSGGAANEGISIGGSISGDYDLTLVAGLGNMVLRGVDVNGLNLTSANDVTLHGHITSDNSINFGNVGNIIIGTDTVLTSSDGAVTQDLIFDAGNAITSAGANLTLVANDITLPSINGTNDVLFTADTLTVADGITTDGTLTFNTGANNLGGSFITSDDTLTLNGLTQLTSNLIFNTGAGEGDILVNNTINGPYSFTALAGTGNFTTISALGTSDALNSSYIQANEIRVKAVNTNGAQNYIGTVMESGLLTGGQTVNMTGDVILGGGVTTSVGEVNIFGNVILTADSILQTGGEAGDILNIEGDILGDYNLDMRAGLADIYISGNMDINRWDITEGNDISLGSGTFTTDEDMDFSNIGTITLSADTHFMAKDEDISPNQLADILMGPSNMIVGPYNLSFEGGHVVLYSVGDPNDPASTPLSLDVEAQLFELLGTISTINEQRYTSLDGLANNLITVGADITLNTEVDLENDVLISTGSGGGNIYFGGPVNGAYNLEVHAGEGTIIADYNFGEVTPLSSLTLTADSLDLYTVNTLGNQTYAGDLTLYGNYTTTGGNLTFHDTVLMTADTTFDTGSSLGGDITFNGTLDGMYDTTLIAGSGDSTFQGILGAQGRLGTFTVESTDNLTFSEGLYVTDFASTAIDGDVTLGTGVGLNATRDITFYTPSSLAGYLEGRDIRVESTGYITAEVVAESLQVGGSGSSIQAIIGGKTGREAVHQVVFSEISGGPHFINGYNTPLLGMVTAPQVLNLTAWGTQSNPVAVVQNTTELAQASLNPIAAEAGLLVANELTLEGLAGSELSLFLNPALVEDDTEQTFRLFDEVEL